MKRKNIRLRREYIYNKENEKRKKQEYIKKLKIKQSYDQNMIVPTELYKEENSIKQQLNNTDDITIVPRTHIDDEYNIDYLKTPNILITTSRQPSSRLQQFSKEINLIFPISTRINRGTVLLKELVDLASKKELTDIIILHEHRGQPDGMIISHMPLGPTLYLGLKNVIMRHDLKKKPESMSEAFPHLIFNNFNTKLGLRIKNILQHLFPTPKFESKRVITFSNSKDLISFRHHTYEKQDYKTINLNEIGPRFELKAYQISLGTMIQKEAQQEWILRSYINTSKKQNLIGD